MAMVVAKVTRASSPDGKAISRLELNDDSHALIDSLDQSLEKIMTDPAGSEYDTSREVGQDQEETLQANRTILMARSPVFYAMFSHGMQESERGEVRIPDFEAPVVRELLHFMYTDRLSEDSAVSVSREDLLRIATKYQVQRLMCLCESQLLQQINEDSAAPLLQLAHQLSVPRLKRACLQFIARNPDKVTKKRPFEELDENMKEAASAAISVLQND